MNLNHLITDVIFW